MTIQSIRDSHATPTRSPRWSICVLTVPERSAKLDRLLHRLVPQLDGIDNVVEILINETPIWTDRTSPLNSVGQKRNALIAHSKAEYVSFVDDDDMVSEKYVETMLSLIGRDLLDGHGPDVATFVCRVTQHFKDRVDPPKLCDYSPRFTKNCTVNGRYQRLPNHLPLWRRTLCLPYSEIEKGEDTIWANKMSEQEKTHYPGGYDWASTPEILYDYLYDVRDTVQNGSTGAIDTPTAPPSKL